MGLKLNFNFKILEYTEKQINFIEDIEFLVGDKEHPILMKRKIKKGYVYAFGTDPDAMPGCLINNLIKLTIFI
jgi:hypothetical protein